MAITIVNTLLPTYFSRNAVEFYFNASDKFISVGAKNRALLVFSTYPAEGDTLKITYVKDGTTYERTFTFRTVPDADLYEAPEYPGSDLPAWVQTVLAALQGDATMTDDWTLGYHADDPVYGVMFQALFESDTNIAFEATGFNISVSQSTSGAVSEVQENYRLTARLYVGQYFGESETNFSRTPEIELDADANGSVKLNVWRYLDDLMAQVEDRPTTNDPVPCLYINRPAYLLFGQEWGNPAEAKRQYRSPTLRILKGGLTPRDFAEKAADLETWLHGRFLTHRHRRRIGYDQDDYLFWFCGETLSNVKVGCRIISDDQDVTFKPGSLLQADHGTTYKFSINPKLLAQGQGVGPPLREMHVWVEDADAKVIAGPLIYKVDDDYLDILFEYENGMGGIEAWKFYGERTLAHQTRKEAYTTPWPYFATAESGNLKTYGEMDEMSIGLRTGPMTAEDAAALPDFLRARNVWLVSGGKRIPVRIPETQTIAERWTLDGDHSRGTSFTVEIARSSSVSRILV